MANGKFEAGFKLVTGALLTITIGVLTFMGNGVVANERRNVDDHTAIRGEYKSEDVALKDTLMGEIKEIRLEQKVMRQEQNANFTQVLVAIESLK